MDTPAKPGPAQAIDITTGAAGAEPDPARVALAWEGRAPVAVADGDVRPEAMEGRSWQPRAGMSSSLDRRGWSRSADMRPDKTAQREQLWATLTGCGGGVVAASERLITGSGDLNWWTYRRTLGQVQGEAVQVRWSGEPGSGEQPPRLWAGIVTGPMAEVSKAPRGWPQVGSVADDSGERAWVIFGGRSDIVCP